MHNLLPGCKPTPQKRVVRAAHQTKAQLSRLVPSKRQRKRDKYGKPVLVAGAAVAGVAAVAAVAAKLLQGAWCAQEKNGNPRPEPTVSSTDASARPNDAADEQSDF